MNDREFVALSEEEGRAATRRAAHLVWLLAIDEDGERFQREVHKLAIGDDADPLFVAQVAARSAQILAHVLAAMNVPMEARRQFLADLIASNAPADLRDLGDPDPS